MKETTPRGNLDVDGRILLKWILRKCDGKVLIGFVWLRTRTVGRLL
jgi:hypothetical protein